LFLPPICVWWPKKEAPEIICFHHFVLEDRFSLQQDQKQGSRVFQIKKNISNSAII